MFGNQARIQHPVIREGKRVLVISDIHPNLPYLKGLLDQVHFSKDDILILDGDFLEKGPDSLGTLHYLMALSGEGNVFPILGNCDEWQLVFQWGRDGDAYMRHYFQKRRSGLLFEMLRSQGIDPLSLSRISDHLPLLKRVYSPEWAFLNFLPHAIETDHFIFAHAGLDGSKPLEENTSDDLTARKAFLNEGQRVRSGGGKGHRPCTGWFLPMERYCDRCSRV